ncbi:hypothetical protein AG0111_0g10270 [Alternaria gaisen]|uniref:Uncharacterized protein n=1 Tax=Alternaria gaisen TaxID=167740 RepID=A0ACB6FAX3_9PLEO|nr:hypothetical protein AG0111_0g10270 [Alternaria gaisen]RYO59528.1 hypothetical protein AA0116_g6963 [Alternaria tenuissima]
MWSYEPRPRATVTASDQQLGHERLARWRDGSCWNCRTNKPQPATMSSAVSSAASPSATGASCTTADFTQFPTQDVFCAVGSTTGIPSNTSDTLSQCCKDAPVEEFNGSCGYYCLAYDQTVADLNACFMDNGVNPSQIFCSGNNTASATGTPSGSGSASRTSGGNGPDATGSSGSTGAAAPMGVSKAGLGMLGMFVISAFAGALL